VFPGYENRLHTALKLASYRSFGMTVETVQQLIKCGYHIFITQLGIVFPDAEGRAFQSIEDIPVPTHILDADPSSSSPLPDKS
jgi:hypothetical protein